MKITLTTAWLLMLPVVAWAQGPRLQIEHLDRLAERAADSVNITIDAPMLKVASAFLKADDKEQAAAKEILNGLQGIYVRTFEFDGAGGYTADDVNIIRKQLMAPGWSRFVAAESKRDGELVELYTWQEGGRTGGLAVIVAEPTELVVVNIVGPIDLAKIAALSGQFGIPSLPPLDGR